jgi:hypothetical protein
MTRKQEQFQFFYKHSAGYSYDPKTQTPRQGRAACARHLAAAERYFYDHDWSVTWDFDEVGCSGCDCGSSDCACSTGMDHETLACVLRDAADNVLASLSGICSPSNDYMRVIRAELALEAMENDKDVALLA